MLNDLKELIAIDSVLGEAQDGAPFGPGPRAALDWFLGKAAAYGLNTGELDGYCGWAEYGDGATAIGILCHADIVPATPKGWTNDPFNMTILDGKVYGRGVADDKGPLVAALHILKDMKEQGIKLDHRIRLIVGCNEETGSLCLKHYRKHGEIPVCSLVPDADFPCINSEKGIMHLTAKVSADEYLRENLLAFDAGDRFNVVPDYAECILSKSGALYAALRAAADGKEYANLYRNAQFYAKMLTLGLKESDFAFIETDGGLKLCAYGVAGHAMAPDKADNAARKIFALLSCFDTSGTLHALCDLLLSGNYADAFHVAVSDEMSGRLTVNLGAVRLDESGFTFKLDCRLPVSADKDAVVKAVENNLNATVEVSHYAKNLYIDEQSDLVQTLLGVYAEETGAKDPHPLQSGGGTYARELPNAIAFGPTFEGAVTNIHNIDECIEIAHLQKLTEIYKKALITLDKKIKA